VEELIALRELLQKGNLSSALLMIDEMEEMSKKDILNKIRSYGITLLLQDHPPRGLIYLNDQELRESLESGFRQAINQASLEVNEGIYDAKELQKMVDKQEICDRAMTLISLFSDN
jgi:hypothetical protein